LLTIQKKQAKYFAFRREKAPVESGLNTYGGKIQNNPTCLLSNASVLLFFVVMHAKAVQANEDPSSFQNS
jgi:hypothetical protein